MEGLGYYQSPIGELEIKSRNEHITSILFLKDTRKEESIAPVIEHCIQELDEYFYKGRKFFSVPISTDGSAFQQKVWNELAQIPYGSTASYTDISLRIGDLNSIRAVGLANGQNPISIIVPCHRVIGKNGDLVGYAGGLDKKEWLLEHEGVLTRQLKMF
ncbi:MAG: methylated-DNA--[protein]-cysteine S-methyltransferase [Flammeovirgaceae bacterium]|nr:methylated-DNA--[protein]-cysteine S-methyltransferase [Flammeovirgaceae bacterium]